MEQGTPWEKKPTKYIAPAFQPTTFPNPLGTDLSMYWHCQATPTPSPQVAETFARILHLLPSRGDTM